MNNKKLLIFTLFVSLCSFVFSAPLYSPTWGFRVDLPVDYEYSGGDNKDRFSFENPDGAKFDLIVYSAEPGKSAPYDTPEALAEDVQRRLNNKGEVDSFLYRQKKVFILELAFSIAGAGGRAVSMSGWAICAELAGNAPETADAAGNSAGPRPLLLAMAYGPSGRNDLQQLHFSVLDSVCTEEADRFFPGFIMEYAYPRETRVRTPVYGLDIEAWIYEGDAEAAQAFVDREFQVLRRYVDSPNWQEAWSRFYRAIYRDSFDRLTDIAFQTERKINVPLAGAGARPPLANRDFAEQVLQWIQTFNYERDFMGSDFVNIVSAAVEGRGDCDSRAMLWAIILNQAGIPAGMMVSRHYSHAMGLADLPGTGARFETEGKKLLVAETTARVSIGLIAEKTSDIAYWLGILFE